MQGIKITADNKISVVDINANDYREIIKCIGCEVFETVATPELHSFFRQPVRLLCDESGLIKGLDFNAVGSRFYGFHLHGNPIVGDILIFQQCGPELIGLDDVEEYYQDLLNYFPVLEEGDSNG